MLPKIRSLSSQALLGIGLVLLATIISLILFITADDELNQSTRIDQTSVPVGNTSEIIPTAGNNFIGHQPIFEDELAVDIELPPDWNQLSRAEKRQLNPGNCDFTSHYMDDDGRCVDYDRISIWGDEPPAQQATIKLVVLGIRPRPTLSARRLM